jgi:LPS sulfotransferase NodH
MATAAKPPSRVAANPLRQLFPARTEGGASFKWPNESADRGYIIFFTGRCGSTELVSCLAQSTICGVPDEYFNETEIPRHNAEWRCGELSSYVANLIKNRSAGRVFGFKIDAFRLEQLADLVDPMSLFPKSAFKYVYMNRRNLLEQGYSYAHAKRTGVWHRAHDAGEESAERIEISDASIWTEIALILHQEFNFERYFVKNSLGVLRIDYEMFCASKAMVVADVMLAIGCTPAKVEATIQGLRENYRRTKYDTDKTRRLIAFRHKYGRQLRYLAKHRGRASWGAIEKYLLTRVGIALG